MSGYFDNGVTGVKICGITSADLAVAIVEAGADALGLNFWPKSKRYVSPQTAAPWARELRGTVTRVAVLVNADDELVRQVIDLEVVDLLQLHGDESPARVAEIAKLGLPVYKALQVKDASTLDLVPEFAGRAVLLDSYNPGEYGGEGRTFPWGLAQGAVARFTERRVILAGGLTPENVAAAVRGVRPAAVDVASGVESAPGVKALGKVRAFIEAVRLATES